MSGVLHLAEDDRFLARMKVLIQDRRWASPRTLAMEIDRIILTEMQNGVLVQGRRDTERRERQVLSEMLNQFLDHCYAVTMKPLLQFADGALQSDGNAPELLARFCRASASIVAGQDQRYKRNREGNPAVLPYLAWSILLLEAEELLLRSNFMVAFEHLCQMYHKANGENERWFVDEANWQSIARWLSDEPINATGSLGLARAELQSALKERAIALPAGLTARFGCISRVVASA